MDIRESKYFIFVLDGFHITCIGGQGQMSQPEPIHKSFNTDDDGKMDREEYDEMEVLERLEALREDMEDLGVSTLAEVIQRIEEMHRRLDRT
jgi:hypothetical protein